jgi:4-amino-4-deoxy-L-arabinose transferase-like glycosyltransferase
VLVFFSASDSKLIPYILPMFPPLALLAASSAEERLRADLRATGIGLVLAGLGILLAALVLPQLLHDPGRAPYFLAIRAPLALMGVAAVAGGVAVRWLRVGSLPLSVVIGATGYACFVCILLAARLLTPLYSGEPLFTQLPPGLLSGAHIYSVRTYDQSLTFYLGHPVTLVEWRGELDFGLTLEPGKGIASLAEFEPRWAAEQQALAVMETATYETLLREGMPMVVRARAPRVLVVSRR